MFSVIEKIVLRTKLLYLFSIFAHSGVIKAEVLFNLVEEFASEEFRKFIPRLVAFSSSHSRNN